MESEAANQLALEREKWKAHCELEQRKLELAEREQTNRDLDLELRRHEQARSKWSNPLVVAIFAAAIAGLSNAAVTVVNDTLQRSTEEERASINQTLEEAKAESARILEMIKTGDADVAAKNLGFLVETGLIVDPGRLKRLKDFLESRKPGTGPSLPPQTSPSLLPYPVMAVKDAKAILTHLGFYKGTVDDAMDPEFPQAVVNFQKSKGIIPDGIIGPQTAVRLKEAWPEYSSK